MSDQRRTPHALRLYEMNRDGRTDLVFDRGVVDEPAEAVGRAGEPGRREVRDPAVYALTWEAG
jgi:hypothetical protein